MRCKKETEAHEGEKQRDKGKEREEKEGEEVKLGRAIRVSGNCFPIPFPLALTTAVLWGVWRCPPP